MVWAQLLIHCRQDAFAGRGSQSITAVQGDSGFLLARKGRRIFRSEPLQHFFDCPFQFAASPEFSENTDHVESALVVELEMLPGDVIVAGTDGVWDNLPEQELLALLPSSADGVSQVRHCTAGLGRQAAWPAY